MRVGILDDEQFALDNLQIVLSGFEEIKIIYVCMSADEFLKKTEEQQPDLVFMDISLPDSNGIDLAEKVEKGSPETKIIFVTAYSEYAVEAFRVNAADYIMKPVTSAKIKHTLAKLFNYSFSQEKKEDFRIIASQDDRFFIITPEEGQCIENIDRDLHLTTVNGDFILKNNITYWEMNLKPYGWLRCHQSFLININQIRSISPMFNSTYVLKMKKSNKEVPVSRKYAQEFRKRLNI